MSCTPIDRLMIEECAQCIALRGRSTLDGDDKVLIEKNVNTEERLSLIITDEITQKISSRTYRYICL